MEEKQKEKDTLVPTNQKDFIIRLNKETGELEKIDIISGIKIPNRLDIDNRYMFDMELALAICNFIRGGGNQLEIPNIVNMPPLEVIAHWRIHNTEFRKMWR
jgi:hypothetical protein